MAIAAPAAFSASPNSTVAADVVGAMLTKWHYLALLAPVVLMLLVARSSRPRQALLLVLLGSAILFASLQIALDLRIRVIRRESPVPIGMLARTDPVRRRFGMLHGISSLAMLLQVLLAAGVLLADDDSRANAAG